MKRSRVHERLLGKALRDSLPLAFVTLVLVATILLMFRTVGQTAHEMELLRKAGAARATVMRLQLQAETNLRGYHATHLTEFLQSYQAAKAEYEKRFEEFRTTLVLVHADAEILQTVDDARDARDSWEARVAEPTVLESPQADSIGLALSGKDLMDRIRRDDATLMRAFDKHAEQLTAELTTGLQRMIILSMSLAMITMVAAVVYASRQRELRERIGEQRKLYEAEKRVSDILQQAFTGNTLPDTQKIGMSAVYIPAGEETRVGGDWYEAFELPDGRIVFSIGDVAGHGIEAAVAMSRTRQAISSIALFESDPSIVLARANDLIYLQGGPMVTAICGYVNPETFDIVMAIAGHPSPVVAVPGADPYFIGRAGVPLGIIPDPVYETQVARGRPGGMLVLYTDGVIEYTRDVLFGQKRLLEAVGRTLHLHANPARKIANHLFRGPAVDDVAILTLQFRTTVSARSLLPL